MPSKVTPVEMLPPYENFGDVSCGQRSVRTGMEKLIGLEVGSLSARLKHDTINAHG